MTQPGQRLSIPAKQWDRIVETAENYQRTGRLGNTPPSNAVPFHTDRLRCKNTSGSDRRLGEVVEIGDFLPYQVERDQLIFKVDTPSDESNAYGILSESIPDTEYGVCIVSGAVKALIDIQAPSDRYCSPVAGSAVLESGETGVFPIIYAPDATGEQECVILLQATGDPPDDRINIYCDPDDMVGTGRRFVPKYGILQAVDDESDNPPNPIAPQFQVGAVAGIKLNDGVLYFRGKPVRLETDPADEEQNVVGFPPLYVVEQELTADEPYGKARLNTDKPRPVALTNRLGHFTPTLTSSGLGQFVDQVWGPIRGFHPDDVISRTADTYKLWQGAPGFRLKSGPIARYDSYGNTDWYAYAVQDWSAPFYVVAAENWRRGTDPGEVAEYSVHYVKCYLLAWYAADDYLFTNGAWSANVYSGDIPSLPLVEVYVSLRPPYGKCPNVVKGDALRCHYGPGTVGVQTGPTTGPFRRGFREVYTTTDVYDDLPGTLRMYPATPGDYAWLPSFIPSGSSDRKGWALADGTSNAAANGGSGQDMTGYLGYGVSAPSYDTGATEHTTASVQVWERLDNSQNTLDGE